MRAFLADVKSGECSVNVRLHEDGNRAYDAPDYRINRSGQRAEDWNPGRR